MKKIYLVICFFVLILNANALDLKGLIVDNTSKAPISAALIRLQVNGVETSRTTSSLTGSFSIALERNVDYKVYIDKEGYEQARLDISTKFSASINEIPTLDITLNKLKVGSTSNPSIATTNNSAGSRPSTSADAIISIILKGKVYSLTYGGLADEQVVLTNTQTGAIQSVNSTSIGNYSFNLQANNTYSLSVKGNAMKPVFEYPTYYISTAGVQSAVQIIRNFENKGVLALEVASNNSIKEQVKPKKIKRDVVARNVYVKISDVDAKKDPAKALELKQIAEQKKIDDQLAKLELERKELAEKKVLEAKLQEQKNQEALKIAQLQKEQEAARKALEQKALEEKKLLEQARIVQLQKDQEAARIAAEQKALEEKKLAEQARLLQLQKDQEAARIVAEQKAIEEKKLAEQARLLQLQKDQEAARIAAEQKALEEKRRADEARIAQVQMEEVAMRIAAEKKALEEKKLYEQQRLAQIQKQKEADKYFAEQKILKEQQAIADKIAEENRLAKEKELAAQKALEIKSMDKAAYNRYLDSIVGTGPRFMHREKTKEDIAREERLAGLNSGTSNPLPISVNENRTPVIDNIIYFGPGKAVFDEEAKKYLLNLSYKLKTDPSLIADISIHADANEEASVVDYLCKLRTKNITDLLINVYKVNFAQLKIRNTGMDQGANDCKKGDANCSELDHQMNRRIEIKLNH